MHIHTYYTINDNSEGKKEICNQCKKILLTKKDSQGRIDNKKYLKEHVGDTAQPGGRTGKIFEKLYGKAPDDLRYK